MKLLRTGYLYTILFFGISQPSYGALTVILSEVGSDVMMTGSGSLDMSGLTLAGTITSNPRGLYPTNQTVRVGGTASGNINYYTGFTSTPGAFGTGGFTSATSGSGDLVAVNGAFLRIFESYVSGASLTTSNVYSGASLVSLGVMAGTYTWQWSSDSFVLDVQPASVPEPSTTMSLIVALALGGVFYRGRK